MATSAETPPGWTKNPTEYRSRARLAVLAALGLGMLSTSSPRSWGTGARF